MPNCYLIVSNDIRKRHSYQFGKSENQDQIQNLTGNYTKNKTIDIILILLITNLPLKLIAAPDVKISTSTSR